MKIDCMSLNDFECGLSHNGELVITNKTTKRFQSLDCKEALEILLLKEILQQVSKKGEIKNE